jgi:aminocarboxymuconate-semialdehyde decarboxylase
MAGDASTIDARLREMDRQCIDLHALSLQYSQNFYCAEPKLAAEVVRLQNEKLAELCTKHPDRFVALGGVSIQHPALAAEQMEYAVRKLGIRGFMIGGRVNQDEISAPTFDPFWRQAETLGTVVFVHPSGFPQAGKRLEGHGELSNTVGNPLETTVALSHMIFSGFLDRFPGVRILAAHGGGYLPAYIGRSDNCHRFNAECQHMKKKPSEYLRGPQLHFDSLVYDSQVLRHLVTTVGASRIVIGTDYAYDVLSRTPIEDILGTPDLTPDEQAAMLGGNAARLLQLDRA